MTPPSLGRFGLPSSLRTLFGLLLVGLLAVPLLAWSNRVEVSVDGEVVSLRTYAATVADVLDRLDVDLHHGDVLSHRFDAPLEEGMAIAIDRAATIEIHVDGLFAQRVIAPVTSVAGVLEEAGMLDLRDDGAEIVPDWTSAVADGDVINVWTPQEVTVTVDGAQLQLASLVRDVDALLVEQGIELGPDDQLNVGTDAPLAYINDVVIERVEYVEEVEEVTLEYDEERRETSELNKGTNRVRSEGREGLREDTYRVTLVDGEEAERELISEEVVREPEPRIVMVGTYVPPPPPPPTTTSSSSTSSSSTSSSSTSSSSTSSSSTTRSAPSGVPSAGDPVWDRLAQCESNGNWSANTGNGYYGGLQFHPDTWRSVGGSGMPHEASKAEQIHRAQVLLSRSWATWGNQWPACSRMLGLS